MVAVVSGNGLGLFDSSFDRLGVAMGGRDRLGAGAGAHFVNAATGNLVLQGHDESLLGRGMPLSLLRTYNSQGLQAGADGWMHGFEQTLVFEGASKSAPVVRVFRGDGSNTAFQWDATRGLYVSTDGAGAHDTIEATNGGWVLVEGSTRGESRFDAEGRLVSLRDGRTGTTAAMVYAKDGSGRLAEVQIDGGDALVFGYDGSGRLARISTREGGVLRSQVRYDYDALGRLTHVHADLTPDDAGDARWSTTRYTYEGSSLRVLRMEQGDGTVASYTWHADGRVRSVTVGDINDNDGDGTGRTTFFTYDAAGRTTHVADSAGRTWSYEWNADGQLGRVLAPAVDGQRAATRYEYDTQGNLSAVTDAAGRRTVFGYDAWGNRILERDAAGGTVQRTFDARQQVLAETRFTVADPDGVGPGQPSGALTTRYVYDTQARLRFIIDATGGVQEMRYASSGSGIGQLASTHDYTAARYAIAGLAANAAPALATVEGWASGQRAASTRVDLAYDVAGRLAGRTAYARVDASGAGIFDAATEATTYLYDAQGLLRRQDTLRGENRQVVDRTSFAYDGLGRLLSTVDASGAMTTYAWDDAGRRLVVTTAGGLVRTEVRNAAGELLTTTESTTGGLQGRVMQHYYDTQGRLVAVEDASGGRHYTFHDAAGRVVGEVDATGAFVERVYDAAGQLVERRAYDRSVTTAGWVVGGAVVLPTLASVRAAATGDAATIRRVTYSYDGAGRLAIERDAVGLETRYRYDAAGRLLQTTQVDTAAAGAPTRTTRILLDADGRRVGQLDAEGYLQEWTYDAAGRMVLSVRYATRSPASALAEGDLAALRPQAAAGDKRERFFFDGRGRQIATLDAEGYLVEYLHDDAGRLRTERAYARRLTGLAGGESLSNLVDAALGGGVRELRHAHDAMGRLATSLDHEGTTTRYTYDIAGRLVRTERAVGTSEIRENRLRYNALGQLIGELDAMAATRVLPGMSEAQLDQIYAQWGTVHRYDALGRRVESTDPDGHKTWYVHDASGRLTHTIRGVVSDAGVLNALGEVERTDYNAFGEAVASTRYAGRIATSQLATLAQALAAIASAEQDATISRTYTAQGRVATETGPLGHTTRWTYSAFGDVLTETRPPAGERALLIEHGYDRRGLRTSTVLDRAGIEASELLQLDAFGRVRVRTDALGASTTFAYDRLGRQVSSTLVVGGRGEVVSQAYDAWGRTLEQVDAMGRRTEYLYDDALRTVTVLTPEGVTMTTERNRHGETVSLTDAAGQATRYEYNARGQVVAVTAADQGREARTYDDRGLLLRETDASGRAVEYRYDALGRTLQRIEDPDGLALATRYRYDTAGRQVEVRDASGRLTRFTYDQAGQLVEQALDPSGLNLRTRFTWDAEGRQLTMTEGFGTAAARTVAYGYDVLGRRTSEVVAPGVLGLTTRYEYDDAGQLRRSIDAEGRATRYTYDEAGRLVHTIDPAGTVTRRWYDAVGREVASRTYAAVSVGPKLEAPTVGDIDALLPTTASAADPVGYRIHDRDGRLRFAIDALGHVTEISYDALGRAHQQIAYALPLALSTADQQALRAGELAPDTLATRLAGQVATARARFSIFDAVGRVRFEVVRQDLGQGSVGVVTERRYDAAGRVVANIAHATTVAWTPSLDTAALQQAITAAGGNAASQQRVTRMHHDGVGRVRYTVDDAGVVTAVEYDAAGRIEATHAYTAPISNPAAADAAAVEAALAGLGRRTTRYEYDNAGRQTDVVDALGRRERFGYDASGKRTSYTDRNNATWNYHYDAAGRLEHEDSPAVAVARYDAAGVLRESVLRIRTTIGYDRVGNVVARTENAGTSEARTTRYEYDARGRQVRTVFPDPGRYDRATGALVATGQAPAVTVTYDALDRAVVQTETLGQHAYRMFDAAGRLVYEIDEGGYVSRHTYNAFGDREGMVRYARAITVPAGERGLPKDAAWVAARLVPDAGDRTITTRYDGAGRRTSVEESAVTYVRADGSSAVGSPRTEFLYNVHGEVIRESVLLEGAPGQASARWAHTHRAYDELGRLVMTVDAEGHVTEFEYTANGELARQVEYARAIAVESVLPGVRPAPPPSGDAQTGFDRIQRFEHDALGRVVFQRVDRRFENTDGSSGVREVLTEQRYDGEGRVIEQIVDGQLTRTAYDALGRSVSLRESERAVLRDDAQALLQASPGLDLASASLYRQSSPFTSMRYDAFGNVLEVRRSATGWLQGQASPPAAAAGDQVMSYRLDWQGRVVAERNAAGIAQFHEYDAADRRTLTTYQLAGAGDTVANAGAWVESRASYDALGRQERVEVSRRLSNGTVEFDQVVSAEHNAFGEIVYRGDGRPRGTPAAGATYVYDGAGRLVSSNAEGGSWRNYGYDLAGRQRTREVWVNVGAGQRQIVLAQDLDRLGRTLREELAPHADINGPRASVLRRFDRWGNVVLLVDARGYETRFAYNEDNQVVRETKPLVKVLGEDGVESWQRPEQRWYYDALGRLVGTRDANGNVRRMTHDAAGRATIAFDAYGNPTRTAYDALGQARLTQDARGYITFRDFDAVGRVVGHGDLVATASGTSRRRTVLESYQLNQNGDRIGVTNALSQTHRYVYDSRGLVLRSQTAAGVVMTQAYDSQGQRTRETNGLRALTASSLVDRDGETVWRDEQTWDFDYFGRLIDHNDLAGRDYDYTYDPQSGQRLRETTQLAGAASLDRSTSWYANGRVAQIVEGANRFRYEYDAAGNRTLEESATRDGIGTEVRIRTQSYYDSHNRLVRVVQDDLVTGKRVFDLSYDYDAVGNRRRVVAQTGYGTGTSPIPVAYRAPEVIAVPEGRTLRAGRPAEFRIRLTDVFLDPEYDVLQIGVAQIVGGQASGLPAWLSHAIDPATGELVFTAGPGSSAALGQQLTLRLTATDSAQQSASVEFSLRVVFNSAPQSSQQGPAQFVVKTGRPFTAEFPAELYFRDLDVGDRLRIDVLAVFPPAPWLSIDNDNTSVARISGTPSAAQAGTYTVTLRARDEEGDGATRTVTLNVRANGAPTVVATPPAQEATLERAYELAMPLSSLFVDPDGDAMQVTASLEDGSALPAWLAFQFLNDRADPLLRLGGRVPADEVAGRTYRIRLLATDSDGASRSVVVSLALFANRAPVVVATPVVPAPRVNVDYRVELPISSLFRDPDGDALLLDLLHPGGFAATGWLRMTVDQAAGTIVLAGRPTSNANHAGARTVEIRARDADGLQVLLPLTLQVRGDTAPTFPMAPPDRNIGTGRSFSFAIPAATDADGDTLTYRAQMVVRERAETVPPTWVDTYVPLPSWLQFNSATRTFSGVAPLQTTAEPIRIRVRALDGINEAEAGFTISIVQAANSGPVAEFPLAPRAALEGSSVSWALPEGAFSDPDGDPLAYSAQVLMPAHRRLQWVNGVQMPVDVPAQWVALSTAGLSINASTGAISGAVRGLEFEDAGQPAFSGSLLIQVRAADTAGLAAFSVFTATVDLRPRGPTSSSHTIAIGETFSYRIPGFVDPEGGALAFSARLQGGGPLPSWLALSADGVLTGRATVPGTVVIELTVTDASGLTSTSLLTLVAANQPPVYAGGLSPQAATPGQAFSYQVPAGAFTDPNGDPLTYTATLSGGAALPGWLSFNAGTRTFSGTPGVAGSWTVQVSASDGASSASGTFTITVSNSAPVNAVALPNRSGGQGVAVAWDLPAGAFTDPNGDPLSYALEVERPGYWEYYEIRPGEPDARWVPAAWEAASSVGLAVNATTGRITGTPGLMWVPNGSEGGYDTVSTYRMRVVARDPAGASAQGVFTVGLNRPPVGPATLSQMVGVNANFSVQLYGFSDPDGQALTWSAVGLPSGVSLSPSGVLSGRLTTPGNRTFTVTVTDTGGLTASATMTLTTGNTAPTYVGGLPSSLAPAFGAPFSWQVPAGAFSDPNGDPLTYSMNQLVETPIWDQETGQWWTYVEERPLPAWLSFNASTRTLTGTPPDMTTLRLQVIASDPAGLSTSREVLLAPSNGAPVVVTPPSNQSATRGASYSWQVPADTFADGDGDPLTWSATNLPPGLTFSPSTRVISGVPTTQGSWTVTLSVSDGRGGTASTTFTLSVGAPANQAPVVVTPPPNRTATQGSFFSWQVPADTFADGDGDPLTWSATNLPPGLTFSPSTRVISGVPTTQGSWTVTLSVSDGRGGTASASFTLTVGAAANQQPVVVTPPPAQSATVGQPWSWTLPAGTFGDPDGDALTYTASGMPVWMSFNGSTRAFGGTPTVAGTSTVTVTASDGRGGSVSTTFTVTVAAAPTDRPPVVVNPWGTFGATVGDYLDFTIAGIFSDPDGQTLTFGQSGKPGWLTFTPATGRFHGTVPQFAAWRSFYVTITATDPGGLSASSAFEIYVEGDGDIPRFLQRVGGGEVVAAAPAAPVEQQAPALASKRQVFTLASTAAPAAAPASKLERSVIVEPLPMPAPAVRDWEEITPIDPVTPIEPASGTTVRRTESWFTYDRENRVQVSNGQLRNGQIVVEQGDYRSFALSYDAVGNQIAKQSWVQTAANTWTLQVTQSTYTLRGELQSVFEPRAIDATTVGVSEARTYDDAGRLIERRSYFGSQVNFQYVDREGTSYSINVGGWLESAETYAYDADGRLLRQVSMSRPEETVRRYPVGSSTPVDIPVWLVGRGEDWGNAADQRTDLAVLTRRATVSYEASATTGYDAAGRVRGYTYTAPGYTHTYRYEYEARDSYLEKRVSGTSSDTRYKPASTTLSYDAAGRQMLLRERIEYGDVKDQLRAFAYNGDGQILTRRDGSIDRNTVINDGQQLMPPGFDQGSGEVALMNNHAFIYAAGQQVASLDHAGKIDVLSRLTGFSNSNAGRGQVQVLAGETLQGVAQRVYGNASLWYILAAANGLTGPEDAPPAGTTLTVPEVRTNRNDAGTFKPYSASEITGPTAPGIPFIPPPPKAGCNPLQIIMIVVAVVVTIYTAGAAASSMGLTTAGAGAGAGTAAAGTAAAGTATAATATATAATAAGVSGGAVLAGGAGLTAVAGSFAATAGIGLTSAIAAGAGAFVGSVASQLVGKALGVVDSFSLRGAVASGLTAGFTAGLGAAFGGGAARLVADGRWGAAAAQGALAGVGSYAANRIAGQQASFSWRAVAASAVSAVANGALSNELSPVLGRIPDASGIVGGTLGNMAGSIVSLHVRRQFGFDDPVNYGSIAVDAFGNALGSAVVEGIETAKAERAALAGLAPGQVEAYRAARSAGLSHVSALAAAVAGEVLAGENAGAAGFAKVGLQVDEDGNVLESPLLAVVDERYRQLAKDNRLLANALEDPVKSAELLREHRENGDQSLLGAIFTEMPVFGPLARTLGFGTGYSAEDMAASLRMRADRLDASASYLERVIRAGTDTPLDRALATGDLRGLTGQQATVAIDLSMRAGLITPAEGNALFAQHTVPGRIREVATDFNPVQSGYEVLIGGAAAAVGLYASMTSLQPVIDRMSSFQFDAGTDNPFSVPGFATLVEEGMGIAMRAERSLVAMGATAGNALLRRFKLVAGKTIERFEGRLSAIRGNEGELAFDLLFSPMVKADGTGLFKRSLEFKYGRNGGIDRTLETNAGKFIDFELKVTKNPRWPDLSGPQAKGAGFFVPDRLGRVAGEAGNPLSDLAKSRLATGGPWTGYIITGRNTYSAGSKVEFSLQPWSKGGKSTNPKNRKPGGLI